MRHLLGKLFFFAVLLSYTTAWGAHPLITDDTGTQGKGKFQIEVNGQYDSEKETEGGVYIEETGGQIATTLSYGLRENADLILSLPYQWGRQKEDGITVYDEQGNSDATLEVKWRFFEQDGLSLALKPGLRLPIGDDAKGLGAGKTGYHMFIVASQEVAPWAFHANLGYIGNENKVDEEKNIWHASLAATYAVIKNLRLVGNVGIERNADKAADSEPAFIIGGVIYSLAENIDLDGGLKYALNSFETDWSLMVGMAFRF